jgi:hypothetical protein
VANLEVRANGANGILLGQDLGSNLQSSRLFFSNGTDGQHIAILNSNNGGFDFRTLSTANFSTGTQRMTIAAGGDVYIAQSLGINQPTPTAKIHVVPGSTQSGLIIAGNSDQNMVRITQTGTGNAFVIEDGTNPDSSPFVIDNAGNVGIGLTTPSSFPYKTYILSTNGGLFGDSATKVGVYGRTNAIGALGSGVEALAYGDSAGTYYGLKSSAYPSDTPTNGNKYIAGYFYADGFGEAAYSVRLQDGTQGVDKILTSINADGDANWKSDIIVTSIIASASSASDLVRITQTGTGNVFVVEDSTNPDTTPFVITNSGRVKIGTTSDSAYSSNIYSISSTYGLETFGNIAGVYAKGLTYGIVAEAATDGMVVAGIMASATNDAAFFGAYYGGLFSANSSNNVNYAVRLQDGSQGLNKVLVDTTGDGSANWKSDLILTSIVASASSTSDLVRITQTGTGNALVVEDSTNPDVTPFIVNTSGNIGVGTASPSTKLHVFSTTSGAIRIVDGTQQSGYVLTSDANGLATWQATTGGGATITNYGDNRIVTSTGTTTGLNGEGNLTFDGTQLGLTGSIKMTGTFSGNTSNFVQSELITQTVLLYMSNNT